MALTGQPIFNDAPSLGESANFSAKEISQLQHRFNVQHNRFTDLDQTNREVKHG
ncbi:MAG: hypothetical protein LBG61_03110 [Burkholderiales bacterium]|jgi:hypothetical protein|nr:hypothetical protein [Burkholderiales bacterium]